MKKVWIGLLCCMIVCAVMPEHIGMPVQHATSKDWNRDSYWFSPWGESGVHKGIDIFARKGTPVYASCTGLVIFTGNIDRGGNVVLMLSPKGRIHYYAHLNAITTHTLAIVDQKNQIGTVGNTGNAFGKPPHLHYSVLRMLPNIADFTLETQGWKKMFYINPGRLLEPSK